MWRNIGIYEELSDHAMVRSFYQSRYRRETSVLMLQWETEMIRFFFHIYAENQERFMPLIFRNRHSTYNAKASECRCSGKLHAASGISRKYGEYATA